MNNAKSATDSTKRLAVMHFDFDQYTLSNLAVIIKSSLPKGGRIKSINKYPSQEYMDRYFDDIKFGPKEYLKSEDDDKEYNADDSGDSVEAVKRYRKYQIFRLKAFYAIFEFDSVETADVVYNTLDSENLGDTGLKLDLRFVDDDHKVEVPDNFLHLVEKLRPNSSKFKSISGFKPSCFAEIKVADTWDTVPQKEEFNLRAFEVTDNELSDVDDYYRENTASEYSGSEVENVEDDTDDGPKIPKYRRERLTVEDYRAKLGLGPAEAEDEKSEELDDAENEEVESIGDSEVDSAEESSDESHDEYVVDETGFSDEEKESSDSEAEDKPDKEKKPKKISHKDKMVFSFSWRRVVTVPLFRNRS